MTVHYRIPDAVLKVKYQKVRGIEQADLSDTPETACNKSGIGQRITDDVSAATCPSCKAALPITKYLSRFNQ